MSSASNTHLVYIYVKIYIHINGHVVSIKTRTRCYLSACCANRRFRAIGNVIFLRSVPADVVSIGNIIFPRDSGKQRCDLLVVIVCRDCLIQTGFHPFLL